ncbi:SOS response-associated peptidase [Chelativorans sp. AA-79]|uniref:SOS response-associated peptidase n=1 Tax=Chelativorans sp. AA-79 TaxID=3028735 RepID=UPI0023F738E6|nr:SOS response-associated peptidase [Chelativorans sp. AA-79]WEX07657.1 SOS response-associated peptidase [Chelativorans sp. AA-79]
MCGRFALTEKPQGVETFLGLAGLDDFPPRFNIAPTQPILMAIGGAPRAQGSNLPDRRAALVRWGFVPGWAKDPKDFPLLINARAESAAEKATFRAAMRHRRTLVPASGFYEWRRDGRKRAQPFWVRPRKGGLVAFAGLMETWTEPGGSEIDTGAILTTEANSDLSSIHPRMPVVIRPEHFSRWLDCVRYEPRDMADLLSPVEPGFFEAIPVSDKVNSVANLGPDLQERVEVDAMAEEAPKASTAQLSLF